MTKLRRREFVTRNAMGLAALGILPNVLFAENPPTAQSNRQPARSASGSAAINNLGMIDLHCHPSLKMYLWNKKLWKRYRTSAGGNGLPLQYTTDELRHGYVKGFLATHYLVEADLESKSDLAKHLLPWIKRLFPGLADKVEHKDPSNFTQINTMIDVLESQVHLANQKQKDVELVIARSFSEFKNALDDKKRIPIAHSIEGAHALGRNFPPDANGAVTADPYIRTLEVGETGT